MEINLGKELLRASKKGDAKRVRELLHIGESVDVHFYKERDWLTDAPKTALFVACKRGDVVVVRLLLEHGGVTKQELDGAFCYVASRGHVEIAKMLTERGANPSVRDNSAIQWSALNGKIHMVKFLLQDDRVNPAAGDNYAVRLAAHCGYIDIVKMLLDDPHVDPSANDNFAVCNAAQFGHYDVVEVLLADTRVDGTAAIRYADPRAVHVLLEDERCGIRVNKELFLKHHPKEVERYDSFNKQRNTKKWTTLWCMSIVGQGWEDVMWPFSDRFEKISLFEN